MNDYSEPKGGLGRRLSRLMPGRIGGRTFAQKVPELLSSDAFRTELEREVLRSDRTSSPLTILVFDVNGAGSGARAPQLVELGKVVSACARKVDARGWYSDADGLRVGLMLHHTEPQSSKRVIQDIRRRFRQALETIKIANGGDISCEMFAYACDQKGAGPGKSELHKSWEELRHELNAGDAIPAAHENQKVASLLMMPTGPGGVPVAPPTAPAEELLRRPLPAWKRVLDVAGALFGLIVLSPVFLLVGLGIKLSSPGPVFYTQTRIGFLGRKFTFWKFRSMHVTHDNCEHQKHLSELIHDESQGDGVAMQKLDDVNPSIFKLGHILRKTSLDELPQLINVLKGEMSLVGPRPCLPYESEQYLRWNTRRFDIVPGMTGMWQVSGKNKLSFKQMVRLDINYARDCSPLMDARILLKTFPAILEEVLESRARKRALTATQAVEVKSV